MPLRSAADAPSLERALAELQTVLGTRVTTSDTQREHHSHGESYHAPALPDIVCFPVETREVSEIMRVSARHGIPVIPFGAGTSVEGQVNAIRGGIAIDLRGMNRIRRIGVEDCDATVEAGVTRLQLVKALENTGLTFFVDPGADATIGGMASTRASGTTTVRYGTMRENVLGLTVVLADGRVIQTGSRARKSSAGYDLTHLFVGSEGTLGVLTEITLRLHPLPEAVSVAVCSFESVRGAVQTVIEAIQLDAGLARVEFLDEKQIEAINRYSRIDLPVLPTLFLEFHGMNTGEVRERAELVRSLATEHGAHAFEWRTNPAERERLWSARHHAYFASRALRPGAEVLTTDVCVPISRLAECMVETRTDLENFSFPATIVGHVGDGNFHVLCVIDPNSPAEREEAA
ncbi:MAG TPA: FAD-linked oxidase C-terminal domain-containing protein, partial [Bryobacteraceae bacterium]|nr:FAD-linked oxidase C-terminal domain-containing protein [Bryobacteraceae bacterium]